MGTFATGGDHGRICPANVNPKRSERGAFFVYVATDDADRPVLVHPKRGDDAVRDLRSGDLVVGTNPTRCNDSDAFLVMIGQALTDGATLPLEGLGTMSAVGFVVLVHDEGPIPIRDLLHASDRCESDLHGLGTTLQSNQYIQETRVGGDRAYESSDRGETVVRQLRSSTSTRSGTE